MSRQVIPIPADRAAEFDLTVDIAIRPKASWDDSRAWTRLRVPLNRVLDEGIHQEKLSEEEYVTTGREALMAAIGNAVGNILEQGIVIPGARDG